MSPKQKEIEDFFVALNIETKEKRSNYCDYGVYDKKDDSVAEVTFIHSEKESAIQEEE